MKSIISNLALYPPILFMDSCRKYRAPRQSIQRQRTGIFLVSIQLPRFGVSGLSYLFIAGFPGNSAIVLNQSVWRKTHYWLSCQVNGKVKAKCRKVNAVFFLNGGHDCFLSNSINFVIDFSPGKYADILKVLVLDKPKALSASSPLSTFWRPF